MIDLDSPETLKIIGIGILILLVLIIMALTGGKMGIHFPKIG